MRFFRGSGPVLLRIVSEYDQEIPQSQTADNPVAPPGRAAEPSLDTRRTNPVYFFILIFRGGGVQTPCPQSGSARALRCSHTCMCKHQILAYWLLYCAGVMKFHTKYIRKMKNINGNKTTEHIYNEFNYAVHRGSFNRRAINNTMHN